MPYESPGYRRKTEVKEVLYENILRALGLHRTNFQKRKSDLHKEYKNGAKENPKNLQIGRISSGRETENQDITSLMHA